MEKLGPIAVAVGGSSGPSVREPDEHHLDALVVDGLTASEGSSGYQHKELPGPLSAEEEKALSVNQKWEPSVLRPRHREILRRILEGATYVEIAAAMGIHKQTVMLVATSPLFRAELSKLESEADFNIVQRAESMSNEALDKLKTLMRSARSEFLQKAAADRILDTAGYSKIERKIVGVVSGEDVIRELNKRHRETVEISARQQTPDNPDNPNNPNNPPQDPQSSSPEWIKDPRQMPGDWGRE